MDEVLGWTLSNCRQGGVVEVRVVIADDDPGAGTATCDPLVTPEPAGLLLLGAGLLAVGSLVRRRRL